MISTRHSWHEVRRSCRLLLKAEADQAALERQLAAAAELEGRYLTDLRDMEAALADKWAVLVIVIDLLQLPA